jgi:hypothetical protein
MEGLSSQVLLFFQEMCKVMHQIKRQKQKQKTPHIFTNFSVHLEGLSKPRVLGPARTVSDLGGQDEA